MNWQNLLNKQVSEKKKSKAAIAHMEQWAIYTPVRKRKRKRMRMMMMMMQKRHPNLRKVYFNNKSKTIVKKYL